MSFYGTEYCTTQSRLKNPMNIRFFENCVIPFHWKRDKRRNTTFPCYSADIEMERRLVMRNLELDTDGMATERLW